MSDEKVESEEEHEGELTMFKTPRRSRKKKDNTSSTPVSASNSVPDPTNTKATGTAKRYRSTRTKKRPISFVNSPNVNNIVNGINESFESAHSSAEQLETDSKMSIDSNDLLSLDDDDE